MYHSISADNEKKQSSYYEINTTPDMFYNQMCFLDANNYNVVPLSSWSLLFNNANYLKKQVIITFDDGYEDFYINAFPILEKFKFTATMFLPTNFISNKNIKFKGKKCLTWQQVRDLNNNGISFGSHTVNHLKLINESKHTVEKEIIKSKKNIEDKLGCEIDSFSYPFAFPNHDSDFMKFLKEIYSKLKYKQCVTTRIGTSARNHDPHFLMRLPVNSYDDNVFFKTKLEGGYDWLYFLQTFLKKIKA
jgi:peptidoglycan/xylan/chitin deacetylase (PgdA/CDA1 family)